ncbi:MAG: glycosyltransferase [Lachnospiraceae bacterium]|nr:glycosyltransferase [Lachnospiraceae bacterium]
MISIIVPVYNAVNYIETTIEMVLKQTFTDWEMILVDDDSNDGTRELLKRLEEENALDGRIRVEYLDGNKARAAGARNRGLELATGRYIAFLDADDVWLEDKLETQLAFMEEKGAAFSFTAYEFGDEEARGTGKIVNVPDKITYREALSRTVIFTSTTMFDTERMDKELIFMPDIASEDTATWWKILKSGITGYGLGKALVIYRRPANSLSSNKAKAVVRIWNLYRKAEGLGVIESAYYFCGWAVRATFRRL